jgi:hypothetical protein
MQVFPSPETELESSVTSRQECLLYVGDSHRVSRFSISARTISPACRKCRFGSLDSAQRFKPLLKVTAIDQIKDFEFLGLQFEQ